jgi:hypothetical protein
MIRGSSLRVDRIIHLGCGLLRMLVRLADSFAHRSIHGSMQKVDVFEYFTRYAFSTRKTNKRCTMLSL